MIMPFREHPRVKVQELTRHFSLRKSKFPPFTIQKTHKIFFDARQHADAHTNINLFGTIGQNSTEKKERFDRMSFNTTTPHPQWIFVDRSVKPDWSGEFGTWAVSRLILSGFYSILFFVAIYMISTFKYQSRLFVVALFSGIFGNIFDHF